MDVSGQTFGSKTFVWN